LFQRILQILLTAYEKLKKQCISGSLRRYIQTARYKKRLSGAAAADYPSLVYHIGTIL